MLNFTSNTYTLKREILLFQERFHNIFPNPTGNFIRDGSKSTDSKNVYEKGYYITEVTF